MEKQFVGIRLEPNMVEAIKKEAKQQDRTLSSIIRISIKKYLESIK
jgi:predicted DNA-binding protein